MKHSEFSARALHIEPHNRLAEGTFSRQDDRLYSLLQFSCGFMMQIGFKPPL